MELARQIISNDKTKKECVNKCFKKTMVYGGNQTRTFWLPNRSDTLIYVVQAANDSAETKLRAR